MTSWLRVAGAALVLALGGCAVVPTASVVPAGSAISGRLAVRVDGDASNAPRSVSAGFELQGDAQAGELNLSTPLGSVLAQARWAPGRVVLATPQGERGFDDLDGLTREVLGESVPVAALFDWLRGHPWPGAASTPVDSGFAQLGWVVDIARFDAGSVEARRLQPPVVTVRARLDPRATMTVRAFYDVPAPAKLNLFLHVVGRRADGYHLLQSLFVLIDWCDALHFELRDDGRLARHDLGTELPPDDLCLRAARALQEASGTRLGADISIDKQVPSGAGMGGGSSDAATTLIALNRLWGLHWPQSRLAPLALTLGADVPFFLGPGNAIVEGIGERLTPVELAPQRFVVVKPPVGIETRAVFSSHQLDRNANLEGKIDTLAGLSGDGRGLIQWTESSRNDLQAAAEMLAPEVGVARMWLIERFGQGRMTGSGSAVFAHLGPVDEHVDSQHEILANLRADWIARSCNSLHVHPLAGWTRD